VTADTASLLALWVVVLVNLGLTVRLVAWSRTISHRDDAEEAFGPELEVGRPAPTFRARATTGGRVTERTFVGAPTTYVFLSPNCDSCRTTLPKLQPFAAALARRGEGIVVVSDSGAKRTAAWLDGITTEGVTIRTPVLLAPRRDSSMVEDYDGPGFMPYFAAVSAEGLVRARGIVGHPDWVALTEAWAGRAPRPVPDRDGRVDGSDVGGEAVDGR
jgi:thiol-disulfide isomerase/thioredoxin